MKLATKLIVGAAALAFLIMTVGSAQAQTTNIITMSLSALAQSDSTDNGTVTTTPSPSKHTLATKDILNLMAQAENAEGNYPAGTTFPTGAKLVVVTGDNPVFQVLDANNNLLVDVSDILSSADGNFGNDIYSGKQNDLTGLAATSTTDLHILTVKYDDTGISGSVGVKFYMTGLMTTKVTETVPVAGVYTRTESVKLASGTGEGSYQGQDFVLTGTLSASGKGTLILPP